MKTESLQKAEQALNKIAAAQLLLEAIDDVDFSEVVSHLCQAYDLISELTETKAEHDNVLEGLWPDLLRAFMEQMIDKNKE